MDSSSPVRDILALRRVLGLLGFVLATVVAVGAIAGQADAAIPTSSDTTFAPVAARHEPARGPAAVRLLRRCDNKLVKVLWRAGFHGANLKEAWAIAMRESGGRPRAVSPTNDIGLFQFNTATWSGEPWWDRDRLLTAAGSARMAARLSNKGRNWYPWGLTGKGTANAGAYRAAGWTRQQVRAWIVRPYREQSQAFDRLPRACQRLQTVTSR